MGANAETETAQILHSVPVGVGFISVLLVAVISVSKRVDVDFQVAGSRHGGVQLTNGTGGGIAGIGVKWLVLSLSLAVEPGEGVLGHEDLATNFQPAGSVIQQSERNAGYGAEIMGDVFAPETVAAGGSLSQPAFLVGEGNGETVYLQLADEVEGIHT